MFFSKLSIENYLENILSTLSMKMHLQDMPPTPAVNQVSLSYMEIQELLLTLGREENSGCSSPLNSYTQSLKPSPSIPSCREPTLTRGKELFCLHKVFPTQQADPG